VFYDINGHDVSPAEIRYLTTWLGWTSRLSQTEGWRALFSKMF